MKQTIEKQVQGYNTKDGAGVNLVRVLGHDSVANFDPILMLDSFDSVNPPDYTAGFLMHPHRGIETISYVSQGAMVHKDSLGNEDTIRDGEVQWMCAGSGILHEEKVPAVKRLLGVQLWLNLPSDQKMTSPTYLSIKKADIKDIPLKGGTLRLLAGTYEEEVGHQSAHLPFDYYDIHLQANEMIELKNKPGQAVMIFTLVGEVTIEGELVKEKSAAKISAGDTLTITSAGEDCQVLFIRSIALKEEVSWGGPIVMNTHDELRQAFTDLDEGTFLEKEITYQT